MIVVTYGMLPAEEARNYSPTVVLLDDGNEIKTGRVSLRRRGSRSPALSLAACSPGAPPGRRQRRCWTQAVGKAVGDPSTCVLIAQRSASSSTATTPTRPAAASCRPAAAAGPDPGRAPGKAPTQGPDAPPAAPAIADGSRRVGWASGPIAGHDLVYAAVMEGDRRSCPGVVIADKLDGAFKDAGRALSGSSRRGRLTSTRTASSPPEIAVPALSAFSIRAIGHHRHGRRGGRIAAAFAQGDQPADPVAGGPGIERRPWRCSALTASCARGVLGGGGILQAEADAVHLVGPGLDRGVHRRAQLGQVVDRDR